MREVVLLAEIRDKMPDAAGVWIGVVLYALVAAGAARWRSWLAGIMATAALVFDVLLFEGIFNPRFYPSVLRELGRWYVVQIVLAGIFAVAAPIFADVVTSRRARDAPAARAE